MTQEEKMDKLIDKVDKIVNNDLAHICIKVDLLAKDIRGFAADVSVSINKLTKILEERLPLIK